MNHVRVLILTAVQPEARALARAFSLRRADKGRDELPLWANNDVALAVIGIRATKLNAVAKCVGKFDGMIMAGVAGALSPALAVGDVVVDARAPGVELASLGDVAAGGLHTSERVVATVAEKASLFASSGCLAVDMETALAAHFAAARGAAFVAVRGISDSAGEALDPSLLTLVDARGRPRIGRAVGMLCRDPRKLDGMLRLGRSTKVAMQSVARTVGKIVASGWPHAPA